MSDMLDTLISANLHKQAVNQPGTNQPHNSPCQQITRIMHTERYARLARQPRPGHNEKSKPPLAE